MWPALFDMGEFAENLQNIMEWLDYKIIPNLWFIKLTFRTSAKEQEKLDTWKFGATHHLYTILEMCLFLFGASIMNTLW